MKLVPAWCALLFAGPVLLMLAGGHYWWNSRIYLMFIPVVLFTGTLFIELAADASSQTAGGRAAPRASSAQAR
jgi:hypothetical protein